MRMPTVAEFFVGLALFIIGVEVLYTWLGWPPSLVGAINQRMQANSPARAPTYNFSSVDEWRRWCASVKGAETTNPTTGKLSCKLP